MTFKRLLTAGLIFGFLLSCGESFITPTGPEAPIPTVPEPEDPIINPGPEIDLGSSDIFSAFALNSRDERTQRMVLRSARNRGYTTARFCVELEKWNGIPVFAARGPYLAGREALEAYENTLRVLADENMTGIVMGICTTLRSSGSDAKREEWIAEVGKRANGYRNIAFEVCNEADHMGNVVSDSNMNRMQGILRLKSGGLQVGSDQNLGAKFSDTSRYRYDYRWHSDFPSFHPWRNPDPTREDIGAIVRENAGFAVLSETTSYASDEADVATFGWLVTTDKDQIQRYAYYCWSVTGCVWTFHSIDGLFADGPFSWMPQRSGL